LTEHAPRGFIRDSGFALNLFGGDAATSGTHEIHCLKPDSERCGAFLEDRSGQRVNVIAAMVASVGSTARHAVVFAVNSALLTGCHATRKTLFLDRLKANVVIGKFSVKLVSGVAKIFRDCLSAIHGKSSMPCVLLVVKG